MTGEKEAVTEQDEAQSVFMREIEIFSEGLEFQ